MKSLSAIISICFLFLVISCRTNKEEKLYILDNELSKIPDSVFKKKDLIVLSIGLEGFTIYPPLSALESGSDFLMPLKEIPDNIGELSELESLTIQGTNITELPASIIKLKKLERLDLSLNAKLPIINELAKLKQLYNLKVLNIFGVAASDQEFQKIKTNLNKKTKIISSASGFMKEIEK